MGSSEIANKIDYTIRIKGLDDGRIEASIIDTEYKTEGISIDDAFSKLMIQKSFKGWKDRQDAEIRKKYPDYFK